MCVREREAREKVSEIFLISKGAPFLKKRSSSLFLSLFFLCSCSPLPSSLFSILVLGGDKASEQLGFLLFCCHCTQKSTKRGRNRRRRRSTRNSPRNHPAGRKFDGTTLLKRQLMYFQQSISPPFSMASSESTSLVHISHPTYTSKRNGTDLNSVNGTRNGSMDEKTQYLPAIGS